MNSRLFLLASVLVLLLSATGSHAFTCPSSTQSCMKCTDFNTVSRIASFDFSSCKSNQTISWVCLRDGTGSLVTSTCASPSDTNKCQNCLTAQYTVPSGVTTIKAQMHDGLATGTFTGSCSGTSTTGAGTVCGSSGDLGRVCDGISIPLSSCQKTSRCTCDNDCSSTYPTNACSKGTCQSGTCVKTYLTSTTVCRASAGPCDVAEVCSGNADACPADTFLPSNTVCRQTAGACDVAETCTGSSASCPTES